MLRVTLIVNGREVEPHEMAQAFANPMEAAAFTAVRDSIGNRLADVRCPNHDEAPRITVSGSSVTDLSWSIEGCCATLVEEAKRALGD